MTVLEVDHVSKAYPGTQALDGVSFRVEGGRFHALLGGNGSGKSTLIKILAGVVHGDPGGRVTLGGSSVDAHAVSATWAAEAGIRFVHQDLGLFASMTVAENIALASGFPSRAGLVLTRALRERAEAALRLTGLDVDPFRELGSLRPAERTLVAVARALHAGSRRPRLLVMDEPTASLPDREADALLRQLGALVAQGTSVLYVTHRLTEVLHNADAVTILRDGRHVRTTAVAGLSDDDLVELVAGRALGDVYVSSAAGTEPSSAPARLEVSGLRGGAVRHVSFSVRPGEILGVAGMVGSGRSSLLRLLFGAQRRTDGTVTLDGREYAPRTPRASMGMGVAYVPEDRAAHASFPSLDVSTNLAVAHLAERRHLARVRPRAEIRRAREDIRGLGVQPASALVPLRALSGGNQQKVVLGRWLRRRPRLLLLDEPTQGVDVGARADIYALVRACAREGAAVVVVSSDSQELANFCDRVLVMSQGVSTGHAVRPDRDWIVRESHRQVRRAA